MKASAWKWIAIAFIVLFAITASFAWANYTTYLSEVSAKQFWANNSAEAWSLVNLENETVLVDDQTVNEPPGWAYTLHFNLQYAGYIAVIVTSTSPSTYVRISGEFYLPNSPNSGWIYQSYDLPVGTSGTAYFPVVPGQVTVSVLNTDPNGATVTVTIIYYS